MQKYPYRDIELSANSLAIDASLPRSPRQLPKKRANRLRISWFILGLVFGTVLAFALFKTLHHTGEKVLAHSSRPMAVAQRVTTPDAQAVKSHMDDFAKTATMPKPPVPRSASLHLSVNAGDTLSSLLIRAGISEEETHSVMAGLRKTYNPRRLNAGQKIELKLTPETQAATEGGAFDLASLHIRISPRETLSLQQTAKGLFSVNKEQAKLTKEINSGGGTIRNSLYQTGMNSGLSPNLINSLINAYSYDVDFQREIKQGDSFYVLYETLKNEEGEVAGNGKLLFATLKLGGQEKKIYHYTAKDGQEDYYDSTGQSVRKALLRTPVNGARLSSGFGMRKHPILGYSKMHKGVDFAAPTGTPIYAAGDGTVDFSGRKGGYGNYVRIRHTKQYASAYAHMSKIAPKVSKGARVRQGDVIGYVGSTGNSTGPHLHYEVLAFDHQVNPNGVKFKTGNKLEGKELASFKANIQETDLLASRMIYNERKLASAE